MQTEDDGRPKYDNTTMDFTEYARKNFVLGYNAAAKKIFDRFDQYACIKDDKWYKELKEEMLHYASRGK